VEYQIARNWGKWYRRSCGFSTVSC